MMPMIGTNGTHRRFEGPVKFGTFHAKHPYAGADNHERQQRADGDHSSEHTDRDSEAKIATNMPTVMDEI